jgi:hypothetical protein
LALILLPARALARGADAGLRRATAAYFLLVGAGFMFVEIAAMQRLVLLFGDPVYAFAATLAAFLVFAGLGSGAAARMDAARPDGGACRWRASRLDLAVLAIAGLATLHALAGPWLLSLGGAGLGAFPRAVLAVALIVPLAFAMGLPFPLVLDRLRTAAPALVPWAWGVNGCASVMAAVLAGVLAMGLGGRGLMLLGALAYLLAAVAQHGIPGHRTEGDQLC